MYVLLAVAIAVLTSLGSGWFVWRNTAWHESGYRVGWVVLNAVGCLLAAAAFRYALSTWRDDQYWALPWLFVLPPLAAAFIVLGFRDRRDSETGTIKCDWCGQHFVVTRYELKRSVYSGRGMYCSGRCQRADEASRGVKERRIRFIDHE